MNSLGTLYIADTFNHVVRAVSPAGTITTVAGNGAAGYSGDGGPATSANLDGPASLAVSSSGTLYIADYYNHRIRAVGPAGEITTVAGNGLPCSVRTLLAGSDTGFAVVDGVPATASSVCHPNGVALDSADILYIADTFNQRIRRVSESGIITTVAGTGLAGYTGDGESATSAMLRFPEGIAIDSASTLFIADTGNHVIRRVEGPLG